MKTDVMIVSGNGNGMDAALALAAATAEQLELAGRDALHMRLLAEEMMNLLRSVISQNVAQFLIPLIRSRIGSPFMPMPSLGILSQLSD